jgi:hypothetical protein
MPSRRPTVALPGEYAEVPLTPSRKRDAMPSETRNRRIPGRQADRTGSCEPAGLYIGHHLVRRQFVAEETAAILPEPDEVLVADARSGLSPSQMVERKLLALVRGGNPGPFVEATRRSGDVRRDSSTPFSRTPGAARERNQRGEEPLLLRVLHGPPEPESAGTSRD